MEIKPINLEELRKIPGITEEDLEDLQDAIRISKEIDEGKTNTYTLEEVMEEFGL